VAVGVSIGYVLDPDQQEGYSRNIVNNIVNNTPNIGTAIHSPVQQAGAQSRQKQVITYDAQERAHLARLVSEFTGHLHELQLDAMVIQKVSARIETLILGFASLSYSSSSS
jgi:hypothetical protein